MCRSRPNKEARHNCDGKPLRRKNSFTLVSKAGRDPKATVKRRMTPCQEFSNVISMVLPTLLCIWFTSSQPVTSSVSIACFSIYIHLPWSAMYHLQMGIMQEKICNVNNLLRVLDQSFLLNASFMFAFALSGSIWYGVVVFFVCYNYIFWLWVDFDNERRKLKPDPSRGGFPGRIQNIGTTIILYLGPMFCRGDYENGLRALMCFFIMGWLFITYPFKGWSHPLFHIALVPYTLVLLNSCNLVDVHGTLPLTSFYIYFVDGCADSGCLASSVVLQDRLLVLLLVTLCIRHKMIVYET